MGVDGVRLEVVGQCPEKELVEDTSLIDGQVVLNFGVAPVGELFGVIIDGVMSVPTDKSYGVGEYCRPVSLSPEEFSQSPSRKDLPARLMV